MGLDWQTVGMLLSWAVAAYAAVTSHRRNAQAQRLAEDTAEVSEAATIIRSYDEFCERLQAELAAKNREIDELRQRVAAMETEWRAERDRLRARITELESERATLKRELAELRARYCRE